MHKLHIHFIGLPKQEIAVEFADQAAAIFSQIRDENGFGASDMRGKCGDIVNEQGKRVGRISYNGRIWDADNKPLDNLVGHAWLEA